MTDSAHSILILEDDVLIAMDLAMLVAEAGGRPLGPYHTADAARSAIDTERPDLALLDFNLGDHTSQGLAEWLRGERIPFVFLTGHSARHVQDKVESARILEKPVSPQALDTLLRDI